jgi:hypothetical protein
VWNQVGTLRDIAEMRPLNGTSGQGLATLVLAKLFDAVPSGTEILLDVVNSETVRFLDSVYLQAEEDSGLRSCEAEIRKRLFAELSNSKWRRILKKAGWQPAGIEGMKPGSGYVLLYRKP